MSQRAASKSATRAQVVPHGYELIPRQLLQEEKKTPSSAVTAVRRKKAVGRPYSRITGRGKQFNPISRIRNAKVGDVADMAKKAWSGVKYLMSKINVETKMFDAVKSDAAVTYSGTLTNLSNVAEGDDYLNREGDSILPQMLEIRGYLRSSTDATTNTGPQVGRVMVIQDKLRTSDTDPSMDEILETVGDALAPYSQMQHEQDAGSHARRFLVLHDQTFDLHSSAVSPSAVPVPVTKHYLIRVRPPLHVTFDATAGADASDYVGALYLVEISNIQTNGPNGAFRSRLYFTDN